MLAVVVLGSTGPGFGRFPSIISDLFRSICFVPRQQLCGESKKYPLNFANKVFEGNKQVESGFNSTLLNRRRVISGYNFYPARQKSRLLIFLLNRLNESCTLKSRFKGPRLASI